MPFSKILIIIGFVLILTGIGAGLIGNKLNWFGNLPGDIKIEKENLRIYIPLTSMFLLSVVLSLALWIIRRFL